MGSKAGVASDINTTSPCRVQGNLVAACARSAEIHNLELARVGARMVLMNSDSVGSHNIGALIIRIGFRGPL